MKSSDPEDYQYSVYYKRIPCSSKHESLRKDLVFNFFMIKLGCLRRTYVYFQSQFRVMVKLQNLDVEELSI